MTSPNDNIFKGEEVQFPVTFDLKAFIDATIPEEDSKASVAKILYESEVPFSHWSKKISSKGKYICWTVSVTIDNNGKLQDLYERLKEVPGLKMAL